MAKIKVEKPSKEKLKELGVESWGIWECDSSTFDWQYPADETAYVLEGNVKVKEEGGEEVEFGAGDLVFFPKGLKCVWEVKEKIKKRYIGG